LENTRHLIVWINAVNSFNLHLHLKTGRHSKGR
jgi:hypothetical protein